MAKPLRREALDFLSLLAFQKRDSPIQDSTGEEQTSTIKRRKLKNASPQTKTDGIIALIVIYYEITTINLTTINSWM